VATLQLDRHLLHSAEPVAEKYRKNGQDVAVTGEIIRWPLPYSRQQLSIGLVSVCQSVFSGIYSKRITKGTTEAASVRLGHAV